MMNKWIVLSLIVICSFCSVQAQILKIGDRFPIEEFKNVEAIAPGKHKATILYFWAHSCSSCVKSFGKLNGMLEEFGDDLNIVLLNPETPDSTESFLKRRYWIEYPKANRISENIDIRKRFDFMGVPYIVWLDEDLLIKALTAGNLLYSENVRRFIDDGSIAGEMYRHVEYISTIFSKEYWKDILAFSYLKESNRFVNFKGKSVDFQQDIVLGKNSIAKLFQYAYQEDGKYKLEKPWNVRTQLLDSVFRSKRLDWDQFTLFDYALKLPEGLNHERFKRMKEDLERYFSVKSYLDTIMIETAVLVSKNKGKSLKTKGAKHVNTFSPQSKTAGSIILSDGPRKLINGPFSEFEHVLRAMVENRIGMPFINEVNFEGNIDVIFDSVVMEFCTIELLQDALKPYNVDIEIQLRPTEVIVVEPIP